MMINQIKPGYTLFITSYIGDADYYNTEVLTGLNRQQAQLVERFVRRCISGYNHPEDSVYDKHSERFDMGRVYRHFSFEEIARLFDAVYPGTYLASKEDEQVAEALKDLALDILGCPDPYTDHLRTFTGLKVAYFSEGQALTDTVA